MKLASAALLVVLWGVPLSAQERPTFDLPTAAFATAAAADWASTYRMLSQTNARESNPLIRWADDTPAAMIALGASMDVAAVYGWKQITRNHRNWQKVGLYGATALRTFFAVRNTRRLQQYRQSQPVYLGTLNIPH